jgi:serine/threonine protein kinase
VDVAHGLEYLHGLRVVHGDLKGVRWLGCHPLQFPTNSIDQANILIQNDYRACLADFGLSTMVHVAPRVPTGAPSGSLTVDNSTDSKTSLVSYTSGGTRRWMSPEMLVPEDFGMKECRPSKQSDCYSLAMTVYEVGNYWILVDASC